jgi:3-phenylpropionate/trans-cinnamate dioxygenase ferredoxin reductase subunit
LEHWTNAAEQGVAAAKRLVADLANAPSSPFASVPYVWSDQYDVKIQVLGQLRGDDEIVVVEGTTEERRFLALAGRGGRLVGAVGFNRPRSLMQVNRRIVGGESLADAVAAVRQDG